jgi:hypothetical protein
MVGTTGDTTDQQLEDLYGELGLPRYTDSNQSLDNDQTLCLRLDESCDSNSTCFALQSLITYSQQRFRGRKNSKALIMEAVPLMEKAMAFVKSPGQSFPSIRYPDSLDIESDEEKYAFQTRCVFRILMLEGERERERTQQG